MADPSFISPVGYVGTGCLSASAFLHSGVWGVLFVFVCGCVASLAEGFVYDFPTVFYIVVFYWLTQGFRSGTNASTSFHSTPRALGDRMGEGGASP